jgi:hypothetical protein
MLRKYGDFLSATCRTYVRCLSAPRKYAQFPDKLAECVASERVTKSNFWGHLLSTTYMVQDVLGSSQIGMRNEHDRLGDLLLKWHRSPTARTLEGFENGLILEIRRRGDRQFITRQDLSWNAGIAMVALVVGLGTGLSHLVPSPFSPQAKPKEISLLLTEIPAASLIE